MPEYEGMDKEVYDLLIIGLNDPTIQPGFLTQHKTKEWKVRLRQIFMTIPVEIRKQRQMILSDVLSDGKVVTLVDFSE